MPEACPFDGRQGNGIPDASAVTAYRAGYYDGILKPLADLYAAHPER
ncbi:hypothetical protein OG596_34150 [Streptomyces sp. NBC_01102]|nr:hypothetical protein OG596_34150 [Streptomyces sp. NBC_01102]